MIARSDQSYYDLSDLTIILIGDDWRHAFLMSDSVGGGIKSVESKFIKQGDLLFFFCRSWQES